MLNGRKEQQNNSVVVYIPVGCIDSPEAESRGDHGTGETEGIWTCPFPRAEAKGPAGYLGVKDAGVECSEGCSAATPSWNWGSQDHTGGGRKKVHVQTD